MNRSHIFHWFILKELLTEIIGIYYPIEIVALIIMKNYRRIRIGCGSHHTVVIKEDMIYVFGANASHQLGIEHDDDINSPYRLVLNEKLDIKSISCGDDHTIISTEQGNYYGWGNNHSNQLDIKSYKVRFPHDRIPREFCADANSNSKWVPFLKKLDISDAILVNCERDHTIITTKSNSRYILGKTEYLHDVVEPEPSLSLSNVLSIKYSEHHAVALTSNFRLMRNEVYTWGFNYFGSLGLGDDIDQFSPTKINFSNVNVVSVDCGQYHTMALTTNGKLYGWGYNSYGQLGLGNNKNQYLPRLVNLKKTIISVSCMQFHTFALTKKGELYCWGSNMYSQLGLGKQKYEHGIPIITIPQKLVLRESILSVHCGIKHTIAVTSNDKIYVWGNNENGQLGLGDKNHRSTPTELKFIPF